MFLRYLPAIIPLALGVYLGFAWDNSPFRLYSGSLKSSYEVLTPSLVAEIEELRKRWDISGVSIAVVKRNDNQGYERWKTDVFGLGVADGAGTPVDHKTLFSLASNTKLFVALSTGITIENETSLYGDEALLTWKTKMKDVVPGWQLMDPFASDYTDVIDLLSHRTGMPRMTTPMSEMIAKMRYLRPSEEFRRTWQYNNLAYHVATTFPESLYGIPFTQYAQGNLLDKLNMKDTYWDSAKMPPKERRSQGFARRYQDVDACVEDEADLGFSTKCLGEKLNIGYFDRNLERTKAHWGVISNAHDMAIWLKMLLLEGRNPWNNETIIPSDVVERTSTGYSVPNENPDFDFPELGKITYGMGQQMNTYRGHRTIDHIGTIPGQVSRVVRIPGSGAGIAVMANDHDFGFHFVMILSWRIMDHVLGLKPIDWERRMKPLLSQWLTRNVPPVYATGATLPDIASAEIKGKYFHEAYGCLTLCLAPSDSEECARELADHPFDLSSGAALTSRSPPKFIARFGQNATVFLLFRHKNKETFTVSIGMTFPETGAKMPSIYGYWDAIFTRDGMAFVGNAWGAGSGVEPSKPWVVGELKENAEVWFDKVQE